MNMQVARNSVITLDYHVTDPDGDVVDEGREPLIYLHGGYEDIFPKIEEALQGKTVGESVKVKLQPDEAFGDYDAEMVQVEPRKDFPKELEVGMQFRRRRGRRVRHLPRDRDRRRQGRARRQPSAGRYGPDLHLHGDGNPPGQRRGT